jgi:hypothetical protein
MNDERWLNPQYFNYLVFERTLIGYFRYTPFVVNFQTSKLTYMKDLNGIDSEPPKINIEEAKKLIPVGWHIIKSYDDSFSIEPDTSEVLCLVCGVFHDHVAENQMKQEANNIALTQTYENPMDKTLAVSKAMGLISHQSIEILGENHEVTFVCSKKPEESKILGILNPNFDVTVKIDVDAVKTKIPPGWTITSIHEGSFGLKAISNDIECLLCKRVHEHDNQWITVCGPKQCIFFKCRRADAEGTSKRSMYLGELKPEAIVTEEDRLRSVEYRNNKPQIDTDDHYCEKHVLPLKVMVGVILVICSFMGTGKTTEFNNYIRRNNPKRVIVLSPRILYTESITCEYNQKQTDINKSYLLPFIGEKFQTYLQVNESGAGKDYSNCNRLVIQMESLHNLMNISPFDVLILDEIESLLFQFGSSTMSEQILCSQVFEKLIRETPIIIGGDAFLSEKTKKILEKINPNVHIIRNDHKPVRRISYLYPTYESLFYRAYQSLSMGKKIVFVCAPRTKALQFASGCAERGIIYKCYVGKSKTIEQDREELKNVNESWSGKVQCIIYNSRITVGVNYNIEDKFDQLFVYGSSHACCVRDTFQGTLRVRHIKENVMHASIYQKSTNNRLPVKEIDVRKNIDDLVISKEELLKAEQPSLLTLVEKEPENLLLKYQNMNSTIPQNTLTNTVAILRSDRESIMDNMHNEGILFYKMVGNVISIDEDKVNQYIANNKRQVNIPIQNTKVREYTAKSVWRYAPEWLKLCLIHNIMEGNVSKVYYRSEFEKYLVRCNYKINETPTIKADEYDKGGQLTMNKLEYSNISEIDNIRAEEIKLKLKAGLGDEMDYMILDKYEYDKMVDDLPKTREDLFNKFYCSDKYTKYHFKNRYDEKYETPESIALRSVEHKYIESASTRANKFALMRSLNTALGIQNSAQGFVVPEQQFNTVIPSLEPYLPQMQKLFNAISTDENPTAKLIKCLDKVYKDWTGDGIVRLSKRKQTDYIKRTEYTISKHHDQSVEKSIKPPKQIFTPPVNNKILSDGLKQLIDYALQFNVSAKDIGNAIHQFGYVNAFESYNIPLTNVVEILSAQGILVNENFASISEINHEMITIKLDKLLKKWAKNPIEVPQVAVSVVNKQYCPIKSEILNTLVNYGISKKNLNGTELVNAIRGLGCLNAFKCYKIPLKELNPYLSSQGISDNETFISIKSSYDNDNVLMSGI